MPIQNLNKIFEPASVAVIGASDVPGKVGYTVLRNLQEHGYAGAVHPINAKSAHVQRLPAVPRVADLPAAPDLAVICTPAPTVAGLVRECGACGTRGVIILSAGFREVGAEGRRLEDDVRRSAAEFPGLRIIGPNCLGILVPRLQLSASFAEGMPPAGNVAFVSQSGALCTAVLDWARSERIGFSCFVSVGNMLDVALDDVLDYLAVDPHTRAVILYVESISEAREFMSAARAFSFEKPLIAYKAGRFAASAKAATSHTGALAGVDAVYDAAFRRAGIVRVLSMDDMFDAAELLATRRPVAGGRLAIVTNAGGPGVMACDEVLARGGELAEISPATRATLDAALPTCWSHGNPVDILGDAGPDRYGLAVQSVLADPGVDAALVMLTPQAMTDPTLSAEETITAAATSTRPVLASWMGGPAVAEGVSRLKAAGLPTYGTPEHAIRAFMHLVEHARRQQILLETPQALSIEYAPEAAKARGRICELVHDGSQVLDEHESKALLAAYGIPVAGSQTAATADEAVQRARQFGYPVVLKIWSPQITHKTDVGGVALGLRDDGEVRQAFEHITSLARARRPEAQIAGVTVERMFDTAAGVELIVGVNRDPVFGPVIMVGMGGVAAEVYRDNVLELPPLSERLARRMLERLRCWPLLRGFRGRPAVHLEKLVEVLMRFSYLVAQVPEIREADINPLLADMHGATALDARLVVSSLPGTAADRPYGTLAICPYPDELRLETQLADGTPVVLRPIRPEDEPQWHAMLERCSPESIYHRFQSNIGRPSHEFAARFCFVDYDRQLPIVAESPSDPRSLLGVCRLIADSDRIEAEYAILIIDDWQHRGLGTLMTKYGLQLARQRRLQRIVALTTSDNQPMLRLLEHCNFQLEPHNGGGIRAVLAL